MREPGVGCGVWPGGPRHCDRASSCLYRKAKIFKMECQLWRRLSVECWLRLSPRSPVKAGHGGGEAIPGTCWLVSLVQWVSSGLSEKLAKEVRWRDGSC